MKNHISNIYILYYSITLIKMTSINDIHTYLSTHTFIPHSMGNYGNYGLNMLGTDSIIEYQNDIWKFYAFQGGSNDAIYYNKNNNMIVLNSVNMPEGITRMEKKN
jgi:hypothetical protein